MPLMPFVPVAVLPNRSSGFITIDRAGRDFKSLTISVAYCGSFTIDWVIEYLAMLPGPKDVYAFNWSIHWVGKPDAAEGVSVWRITSLAKRYVWVSTSLGR